MVTLNHIMLSGMCVVLEILVTSMKQRSKPTRNSLHGKTLQIIRPGKKVISKELQTVRGYQAGLYWACPKKTW